jgi:hypothetical protein
MSDDYHLPVPRRNPEDIDLGAIKADLELLIERVARFRKEQALKPLYTMIGSAELGVGKATIQVDELRAALIGASPLH